MPYTAAHTSPLNAPSNRWPIDADTIRSWADALQAMRDQLRPMLDHLNHAQGTTTPRLAPIWDAEDHLASALDSLADAQRVAETALGVV